MVDGLLGGQRLDGLSCCHRLLALQRLSPRELVSDLLEHMSYQALLVPLTIEGLVPVDLSLVEILGLAPDELDATCGQIRTIRQVPEESYIDIRSRGELPN